MPDLVPQIGSDATLDVCTSAMVAIYNVRQYNHSKVDALTKYGDALRCTRKALQDPAQPVYTKMQIASIIFVCGVRDESISRLVAGELTEFPELV